MSAARQRILRGFTLLLPVMALCAFIYLLKLRFDAGDALPAGSSLRSDPLGTEVLFESLNNSGVALAERNYFSLDHAQLDKYDAVVLFHSYPPACGRAAEALQEFVTNRQGRLLFTLAPQQRFDASFDFSSDALKEKPEAEDKAKDKKETEDEANKVEQEKPGETQQDDGTARRCPGGSCGLGGYPVSNLLWKSFAIVKLEEGCTNAVLMSGSGGEEYGLPASLPVRTVVGLSTNLLNDGWKALYACGEGIPVVVEYHWGGGSVVISSLSYPFSNEAMRADRNTGFLLWAFGDAKKIAFDESHFGLVVSRTVAKLIRKNNLHYALLALLVPVILYFRLAMIPLLPRYQGDDIRRQRLNESSGSALGKLLMRSVPPANLITAALDKWRAENRVALGRMPKEKRDAFEELIVRNRQRAGKLPRDRDIVNAWNEVVELVKDEV